MPESFGARLKHSWDAFVDAFSGRQSREFWYMGPSSSYRPDRVRMTRGNERTIVTAIYNRIALDVAAVDIRHVRLDDNDRYKEDINSNLNDCLSFMANKDQTAREFIQDVVMSMFDEGCIAIVPVKTTVNPRTGSFDIDELRTGKIVEWYPTSVKVNVYNEATGKREDIIMGKSTVAIIENPFYAVMNEPNSTVQRLIRKLALLDAADEDATSGKLDLIIQLPYVIKSEARQRQAEERRKQIERQLSEGRYGIAYTDGTERITQLNRSVENNLLKQIEYLQDLVYSQLTITQEIMNGTADEATMLNYQNRTIAVILSRITESMKCKFLTKTARTQRQSIEFFQDPFKLVPIQNLADIADKFTRNEIMSSNEIRQIVGMKPSKDPEADELRNKNISQPVERQNQPSDSNEQEAESQRSSRSNTNIEGGNRQNGET